MTNMPEAKLAREAEMCYATVAMVTDYDCWHPDHDNVTVDQIVKVLLVNADNAKALIKSVSNSLAEDTTSHACNCKKALNNAVITSPSYRSSEALEKLSTIASRILR
jgi:5'-methylthioadenosine phosphorylase